MTVVDLHPEELFDKMLEGELLPAEAERLRQHLQGCKVCRFEYAARLDFQDEALQLASSAPPALPLRPLALPSREPAVGARSPAPRRRARRRLLMIGVAAAALITASAAVAASVKSRAPWSALTAFFSDRLPRAAAPSPREGKLMTKPSAAPARAPSAAIAHATAPVAAPSSAPAPAPAPAGLKKSSVAAHQASVTRIELAEPPRNGTSAATDSAVVEAPPKEPTSAAKLFGDANQARRSGDIGRASGLYHLLQEQHAGSPEAELSRVTLALLQLDSGDAQAALVGFERYLAGSSRGLEAEALVGRARALGRLGRRDLEISAWQEVQRKYARSIYGRQATERLSALGQP
ncbi:MAG: hypothetical protein EOO73_07800 [Myxococcales bacterium]|nr:MAG: hypothetical protein EOO73_07800 [Myxococcales bacterium]